MAPFPLNLVETVGSVGATLVFLGIGFFFGFALEIAGFGNSKKLAAQFYFSEMTVLKVMFTAIVVAMIGVYGASAVGLLDLNLIWINPTYMWPGILGGLIMGFGFIIGGFCPGTSLVAAATGKLDGVLFALGVAFGVFLFGETVDLYGVFFNSSYMGRFSLPELFGIPAGYVVVGVVLMALFMFWGAQQLEKIFGKEKPQPKLPIAGAGVLVVGALAVLVIGQPTTTQKWARIEPEKAAALENREVQISAGELLNAFHDHEVNHMLLDVRDEADYNLFHLRNALLVDPDRLDEIIPELHMAPPYTVFVLMSNDEAEATEVWKTLVAESLPNVYILEGGINGWLDIFAGEEERITPLEQPVGEDELRYAFGAALGSHYAAAYPHPDEFDLEYVPKIKLEKKRGPTGGGCG